MSILLPEFLKPLYGDQLLMVPDRSLPAIRFAHKQAEAVTFFIDEYELKQTPLVELLKKIVAATGIPTEKISFGRIERTAALSEFMTMKTAWGVIFNPVYEGIIPAAEEGKQFLIIPTLSEMADRKQAKAMAWEKLKELMDKLTSPRPSPKGEGVDGGEGEKGLMN